MLPRICNLVAHEYAANRIVLNSNGTLNKLYFFVSLPSSNVFQFAPSGDSSNLKV